MVSRWYIELSRLFSHLLVELRVSSCFFVLVSFEWSKKFNEGYENLEDVPKCGEPLAVATAVNSESNMEMVRDDRWMTVRLMANDELGIQRCNTWDDLSDDLDMRIVHTNTVPKLLNNDPKDLRIKM